MKSAKNTKRPRCRKVDTMRMKDIVSQLADIIHLLCHLRGDNTYIILKHCTNITDEELNSLNIFYSQNWYADYR